MKQFRCCARALELNGTIWKMEAQLGELAHQTIDAVAGGQDIPPGLAGQKFPPLFTVESEYHLTMVRAELAFVTDLVRRIVEEGWGPVEVWRSVQRACVQQHEGGSSSASDSKSVSKRSPS